ncbi:MAG TPA: L,D-transpeptidase [Labilithrix sp.]
MRVLSVVFALACGAFASCTQPRAEPASDAAADASTSADAAAEAEDEDAGKGEPQKLAATNFQVSVVDRMAWPESGTGARRLGYLRAGDMVLAYDRAIPNDECADGWIELVSGGWVCGKAVTFELSDPRVKHAVHPPDRDAGMPYKYAVNLGDGTPVYRRVLSIEDRKKYEPDLVPPPPKPEGDKDKEEEEAAPEGDEQHGGKKDPKDAGADASAPKPRLKDFKGKGVLVRKLGRGFIVGLDHEFKAAGAHWWRTTFGFAVPHEKLMLKPASTKLVNAFFGDAPLASDADGGESIAGSVGFVANEGVRAITLDDDGKLGWGKELPKRSSVLLTGRETTNNGTRLHETANGFWVRLGDLKLVKPTPPADLEPNEKWIDIDLGRQSLVAFEGTRPVFATLVSSGRRNPTDKEKDFPTPTGSFRIHEKHITTTMDGDVASDGPYSIEDVPWVMYFQGSYALHGAFWHDQFGHMRSHGCVNLAPEDARAIFAWSDPQLPPGWHGVFSADEKSGTRVIIHEDAPPKRR